MTEEWLDFIIACRSGTPHNRVILEGPMADDTIYKYIQEFQDGKISREAFCALVKVRYLTHQICFNTPKALETIKFNFIVQEFSGFFKPGMNCTFQWIVSIFFLCGWGDASQIRTRDFSLELSLEPYVSLSRHTAQIDLYLK